MTEYIIRDVIERVEYSVMVLYLARDGIQRTATLYTI